MENEEEEGFLVKHNTRESIEEAIFNNIHRKRFFLAETAPACNGRLRGLFGYNAATVGVVHANVGQKLLNRNILSNFFLSGFVFLTLLLVDATDFRNQSPKRSQL